MAESYRPLSRHSVKIPRESSAIIQTVHTRDPTIRTDYGEVNVYETTVRPTSRRAEGHTRPKSGYNNRFRRERSAAGPTAAAVTTAAEAGVSDPIERPRTSRGHREGSTSRQSGGYLADDPAAPRPKSGYGQRRRSIVLDPASNDDVPLTSERPQTRRERRLSHGGERSSRTPPPPTQMLQREKTFYDVSVTSQSRPPEAVGERSQIRHDRSTSQLSNHSTTVPATPRNTSDPAERPKTGHGRRRQHSQGDDLSPTSSGTDVSPRSITERPPTRAGRRRSQPHVDGSDISTDYSLGQNTADILVVEDERPRTSRARRRNQHQIDLSYMSPRMNIGQDRPTPSPPPKPPTGWRRQKNKPPSSPMHDTDYQTTTPVMSRPTSSSFNRYAPLPAIGSRQDTQSSYHIHIPHAGDTNISSLTDHTHRLALHDDVEHQPPPPSPSTQDTFSGMSKPQHSGISQESLFPSLSRHIELPPEPSPAENRLILAIKLPDGTRVQRAFRPDDKLSTILNFAEVSAQLDFSQCELVCDVPRQVYKDLWVTIADSGLQNRTVVHVQIPDD